MDSLYSSSRAARVGVASVSFWEVYPYVSECGELPAMSQGLRWSSGGLAVRCSRNGRGVPVAQGCGVPVVHDSGLAAAGPAARCHHLSKWKVSV